MRRYVRTPLEGAGAHSVLEQRLGAREAGFARLLDEGVFSRPDSPYLRLFASAGIELEDVRRSLDELGLEPTLERLYDEGVRVSWDEFKGRRPLRRPGLDLSVSFEDFDNPVRAGQFEARSGGSSGSARRVLVDLDLLEHECAYHAAFLATRGVERRPLAIWVPALPGVVGMKTILIHAKLGRGVARWFSQSDPAEADLRHRLIGAAARATGRSGTGIPKPEHTPAGEAPRVAEWLAAMASAGTPAVMVTTASGGVRACIAAMEGGLDIEGTLFSVTGEPYTAAKAAVFEEASATGASHYAMAEAGAIGLACGAGDADDDVHLLSDKIATIQRPTRVGSNGATVPALVHTTLLPSSPKLMLNVESGDYGVMEQRDCGCGMLPAAYGTHLHTIRSHEKLTSEGMSFLGSDLITLLEEVLPTRFGGRPTDYQLLEREEGGLTRASLIVRSGIGEIDADAVARSVLEFLRSCGQPERLMAEVWDQGETLEVVRGEPHVTPGSKIMPLQTVVD